MEERWLRILALLFYLLLPLFFYLILSLLFSSCHYFFSHSYSCFFFTPISIFLLSVACLLYKYISSNYMCGFPKLLIWHTPYPNSPRTWFLNFFMLHSPISMSFSGIHFFIWMFSTFDPKSQTHFYYLLRWYQIFQKKRKGITKY